MNLTDQLVTLGDVCRAVGVGETRLRRLCNLRRVPFFTIGRLRVFKTTDVPAIRKLCEEEGYVKPITEATAHAG